MRTLTAPQFYITHPPSDWRATPPGSATVLTQPQLALMFGPNVPNGLDIYGQPTTTEPFKLWLPPDIVAANPQVGHYTHEGETTPRPLYLADLVLFELFEQNIQAFAFVNKSNAPQVALVVLEMPLPLTVCRHNNLPNPTDEQISLATFAAQLTTVDYPDSN